MNLDQLTKFETLSKEELIARLEMANQVIQKLSTQNEKLRNELGIKEQESLQFKDQLLIIRNELFGTSSEKRSQVERTANESFKKDKKEKVQLPSKRWPKLNVVINKMELAHNPICKCCGSEMEKMNQVERSEYVEVITRKFFVNRQEREKYRCSTCHGDIVTTPCETRLVPGGQYSNNFAIEVAVSKYSDHMPIERQVKQMHREGLVGIQSQTLIEQTHHLADAMRNIYRALKEEVQGAEVLFADETSWKMLEGHVKHNWYLWGFFTPKSAFYKAHESRSKEKANDVLKNAHAQYLMVDGYTGYHEPSRERNIKIANCWAHVRRKFLRAEKTGEQKATEMIKLIDELYVIEKNNKGSPELLRIRKKESYFVVDKIRNWLYETQALPKTYLGEAIKYTMTYWEGLTRFLECCEIPLDNNLSERSLRGPVVGRKNFYGNHSQRGAETSAILYSICESCKLNQIDPKEYMQYALKMTLEEMKPETPFSYATSSKK